MTKTASVDVFSVTENMFVFKYKAISAGYILKVCSWVLEVNSSRSHNILEKKQVKCLHTPMHFVNSECTFFLIFQIFLF